MRVMDVQTSAKLWERLTQVGDEITMIRANCDLLVVVNTAKAHQGYSLAYEQRNTSPTHLKNAERFWEIVKGALLDRLEAERTQLKFELVKLGVEVDG